MSSPLTRRAMLTGGAALSGVALVGVSAAVLKADEARATELDTGPVSPGLRLWHAIAEAKAALAEIYGCEVADLSKSTNSGSVFVLAALPHPMDRVKWFIDDGSPLLPNEVAWAKYEADRIRLAPEGGAA